MSNSTSAIDQKNTLNIAEEEEFHDSCGDVSEKVQDVVNLDDEQNNSCSEMQDVEKNVDLANEAKEEGNNYFRAKDYDNAISSYSRAVSLCPTDDEHKELLSVFLGNRAAAYFSVDEYDCVIDDCSASLELKSDYVKVLMRRSQAYEKVTRPEDALVGKFDLYPSYSSFNILKRDTTICICFYIRWNGLSFSNFEVYLSLTFTFNQQLISTLLIRN